MRPPIIRLAETDSTNSELARRVCQEPLPPGTLLIADCQTAGRGRLARRWQSLPGNLMASFLWYPDSAPTAWPGAALAAACALRSLLAERMEGSALCIKWPNDLLLDGAKLGGLLLEAHSAPLPFLVIGIGLNLAGAPADTPYPATCCHAHGCPLAPAEAAPLLQEALSEAFVRWDRDGLLPFLPELQRALAGRGSPVTIHRENAPPLEGILRGLDTDGALLLDTGAPTPLRLLAGDLAPSLRFPAAAS